MAFAILQAVMPSSAEKKLLHPFFNRSNNGISSDPGDYSEDSTSSISSPPRGPVEALSRLPGQVFSAAAVQANSIENEVVQSGPGPIQKSGSLAHALERVRRDGEPVQAHQPKIRNDIQLVDGRESLAMGDIRKRRKLSPCTERPHITAIGQAPAPTSESAPRGCDHPRSMLGCVSPLITNRTLPSSVPTLGDDQNSHIQGSLRNEMETGSKSSDDHIVLNHKGNTREETKAHGTGTNPKKILRLNGAGRLGSPDMPGTKDHQVCLHRAPKQAISNANTKVVVLRYKQSDKSRQTRIGEKIDHIQLTPSRPQTSPHHSSASSQATDASKPTHPFFLGKLAPQEQARDAVESESQKADPVASVKHTDFIMSFSTPGKMRYQAYKRVDDRLPVIPESHQAQFKPYLLPGIFEASWPAKGFVHVGNLHASSQSAPIYPSATIARFKGKSKATEVEPRDQILHCFSSRLFSTRSQRSPGEDKWGQPRSTRLLLPRDELKARVLAKLQVQPGSAQNLGHEALVSLFDKIGTSLSPFDKGECECNTWAQKYGPNATAEVLQPGREMQVLRSWLASQAVVAPESGSFKKNKLPAERRRRKKRQRFADDLDDFILDSDDESMSMRDLSDTGVAAGSTGEVLARSRIQYTSDEVESRRSANMVLISGPHGCGKTAAALAAAKELGFEVFEIGPGNKRSGKDILEKVGDMALNHQVTKSEASPENEKIPQEDNLGQLRSEYQGTLTSFITTGPKRKLPPKVKKDPTSTVSRSIRHHTQLKQSLILLEEVDILFEQDKQFWETVLELAIQSKRPIIMTCSDEDLVPLHELSLHAILRFHPPHGNLAAKYLLLLAAAEGHLLSYEAVADLYKFRAFDLRASIFDLNFWCQMAVGDRKGGMQWYRERWPPGAESDEQGHPLRIVSETTLVHSIEVLEQLDMNPEDPSTTHERSALEAWVQWGFEPANLSQNSLRDLFLKDDTVANCQMTLSRLNSLIAFDRLSEQMSAVDIFSSIDVPSVPQTSQILDSTQPPMLEAQKADFVQGRHLLQADLMIDYPQFDAQIATYVHLRVREEGRKIWHACVPDEWGSSSLQIRKQLLGDILNQRATSQADLGRVTPRAALSTAFGTLREVTHALPSISSFDRNISIVAEDLAPYVRSIAAYEQRLERRREMLSLTQSGPNHARVSRRTRVSRSAMEGSQRDTARRERWFGKHMDLEHALKTAGCGWPRQCGYDPVEKSDGGLRLHED